MRISKCDRCATVFEENKGKFDFNIEKSYKPGSHLMRTTDLCDPCREAFLAFWADVPHP